MPTEPRYPPDGGIPRCPICDAPYQTCTGHPAGWDSDPQYPVGIRLPRRVPVRFAGITTQAFQFAPSVKGAVMADKPTVSAPRSGGVHRTFPVPKEDPAKTTTKPAPAKEPAKTPAKPVPKEDAA